MRGLPVSLALLALTMAASAQTPAPPVSSEPETVYSDAQREEDGSVSRRAVQSVMQESKGLENQYPRWKTPVCFNVHGLTPIAKFVVERRMKEIARQVGVTLDRQDPCVPNVTVLVTPDAQATMQSIYEADPDLLGPEYTYMVNDLKRSQPVQAWYGVAVKGSDGRSYREYAVNGGFGDTEQVPWITSRGEVTRLSTGYSTALVTALIVVDTRIIMGHSLGTAADYFAMLALAQVPATRRCKEVPTIANLMHEDCEAGYRVEEITDTDLAMLTGLYQTPDNRIQLLQKTRIIGNMRRALEKQAAGK